MKQEGYSQSEATEKLMHEQSQTVGDVTDADYIQNLREVILDGAEAKKKFHEKLSDYQENYPQTYLESKLQHLVKEKQGQSELEMYTGVPDALASRKRETTNIVLEPRRYNIDEL